MANKSALALLSVVAAVGTVGAYFVLKDKIGLPGQSIKFDKIEPTTVRDKIDTVNVAFEVKTDPFRQILVGANVEIDPNTFTPLGFQLEKTLLADSNGIIQNSFSFIFNLNNTKKTTKGITLWVIDPTKTEVEEAVLARTGTRTITILPSTELGPPPDPEPTAVIRSFSFNPSSGEKSLVVGFQLEVSDPSSFIEWNFGDGTATVFNSLVVSHTYFNAGNFNGKVTVTNPDGRKDSRQFSISVTESQLRDIITNFFQGNGSLIGDEFFVPMNISLGIPNSEIDIIEWNFGDGSGPIFGLTNINHGYKNPGTFAGQVSVVANDGRIETKTFSVFVPDLGPGDPQGEIQVLDKSAGTYKFFANFQGQPPLSYSWKFGDGKSGSGQTIEHEYTKPGFFTVEVTVRDPDGRIGTDTVSVFIRDSDLEAQPGDVNVSISRVSGTFDYKVLIKNLRSDVKINGRLLWRLFQGSSQIDSRSNNIFLNENETFTDHYILKSGLPAGDYILRANYINNNTNEFLGVDSITVIVGQTGSIQEQADQIIKEINRGDWIMPSWYETTIQWYLDGLITAQVFVDGFIDLVDRNIITKA